MQQRAKKKAFPKDRPEGYCSAQVIHTNSFQSTGERMRFGDLYKD